MVAIGQWLPRFVLSSFGLALNLTSRLIPRSDRTPAGCPTIESLIREKGYPFETHEVTTEDGYLIDVHRIPYGRNKTCGYGNESGMVECGSLGPIFVMTGLLADSASLVLDFPGQSLGFVLADSGYDVWLGNTRGNTFGRRHQTLSVGSRQFWNFSFEEHAFYDLPAQIDYVLNETANRDLFFIGISQGTLTFFAMMSEKPEYNAKVKAFAGLAPFYKLANIAVPPLAIFGPYIERPLSLVERVTGYNEILPKDFVLMGLIRFLCSSLTIRTCAFLGDTFNNLGSKYINKTRMRIYLCHNPAGTSMKNVIHFGQLVKSKRSQKFDYGAARNMKVYGQAVPPEYNLSRVATNIGLFSSQGDQFVTPKEVADLRAQLGNNVKKDVFIRDPNYTHVHFAIGLLNQKYLFNDLLGFLGSYRLINVRSDVTDETTTISETASLLTPTLSTV